MKEHRTIKVWKSTWQNLKLISANVGRNMTEIIGEMTAARLYSVTCKPKENDFVLFTGLGQFNNSKSVILNEVLAKIIDIDDLSSIGDYPDRYTIKLVETGDEFDCTRDCLAVLR